MKGGLTLTSSAVQEGRSEIRLNPSCNTHFLPQQELEFATRKKIPSFYCATEKKIDSLTTGAVPISPEEHR